MDLLLLWISLQHRCLNVKIDPWCVGRCIVDDCYGLQELLIFVFYSSHLALYNTFFNISIIKELFFIDLLLVIDVRVGSVMDENINFIRSS